MRYICNIIIYTYMYSHTSVDKLTVTESAWINNVMSSPKFISPVSYTEHILGKNIWQVSNMEENRSLTEKCT
jgi:membrane carboxypeptidase/penicillin-binding protein